MNHSARLFAIVLAATTGQAKNVHRFIDPKGNVLYSSEPPSGAETSE